MGGGGAVAAQATTELTPEGDRAADREGAWCVRGGRSLSHVPVPKAEEGVAARGQDMSGAEWSQQLSLTPRALARVPGEGVVHFLLALVPRGVL